MPKANQNEIAKLKADNRKLLAENAKLRKNQNISSNSKTGGSASKTVAIVFLVGLAGALLLVCNILFWAGRTTLDNKSYTEVSAQIIKDPEVRSAVALYATDQIFQNNDVPALVESVLPPQASFLAQPLSARLEDYTEKTLAGILARPQFQQRWVEVNSKVHSGIIQLANSPSGRDGVISLNEAYQALSLNLKGTKLEFLAGKQLPDSVGQVTVLKSDKLRLIHILSSNLNTFKYVSLALVMLFTAAAVWISGRRRRLIIVAGLIYSSLMLATILGLRIASSLLSSRAEPQYQTAIKHIADILTRPLVIQSYTIILLSLLAVVIAYMGGRSKGAIQIRKKVGLALEGKAHQSLFSNENKVTIWTGAHKLYLRLATLLGLILAALLIQLTPRTILSLATIGVMVLLLIEVTGAPPKNKKA